jgi:CRISPR-associated exonuclease Cas4
MIEEVLFAGSAGMFILALAGFVLLFNEYRAQHERLQHEREQALNLPVGELVYENHDGQGESITSDHFPLIGKPTYVIQLTDGRLVPVEVKPTPCETMTPIPHHALQIAAYCLILEDYDAAQPPTHGILRYTDREFTVDYTPALRKKVIKRLGEMTICSAQYPPALQKQKATKCRACIFQPICPVGQGVKK